MPQREAPLVVLMDGSGSLRQMERRAGKLAPNLISTSRLANPEGKPRQFFKFISAAESWVWRELGGLEGVTPFRQKRLSDDFPRAGRARNWGQKHRGGHKERTRWRDVCLTVQDFAY
jgi:hypothetical protein